MGMLMDIAVSVENDLGCSPLWVSFEVQCHFTLTSFDMFSVG